jgi:hypothetical protein
MVICMYVCIHKLFIFVIARNQMKTVSVCLYGYGHSDCVIVRSHPVSVLSHDALQDRYYIHTLLRSVNAL